jgi:hypothetical protein
VYKYSNPLIPGKAVDILQAEAGSILDVGGGSSPWFGASHIVDVLPFSTERLRENAWGRAHDTDREYVSSCAGESSEMGAERIKPRSSFQLEKAAGGAHYGQKEGQEGRKGRWAEDDYTQFDLCSGERWPFEDQQFDLGLCSHTLEDLRDPLAVLPELGRVCRRVLIIAPSRLVEQTKGIEHPRYCGFYHHPWMIEDCGGELSFRRKSQILNIRGAHLVCPIGRKMDREHGSMFWYGEKPVGREDVFWEEGKDFEDYSSFIEPFRSRNDLFVPDPRARSLKYRVWKLRQKLFGVL